MIEDKLYSYSLFAAWVLLTFFGSSMLFSKVPDDISKGYICSRRILGVAFYCFALQIFVQWMFEFRETRQMVASALNFTCFYLAANLFGMSFISLLDNKYIRKRLMVSSMIRYVILVMIAWIDALMVKGNQATYIMIFVALWFAVDSVRITLIFFRTYRKVTKEVDDYYADDVMAFVKWLYKSTFGIIIFGLSCTFMAFATQMAIAIYMILGIWMFAYIYVSFQNYVIYYGEVSKATENIEEAEDVNSEERTAIMAEIGMRMCAWKAEKGYLDSGVTIEKLASELRTNRTYISAMINQETKQTFRGWITKMRIEDAKQLLANEPDMTVTEIAGKCGFSSNNYFTKVFNSYEKMTPAKWRQNRMPPH